MASLVDLAGSSINIRARWWTDTMKSFATDYAVMNNVEKALDAKGFGIPFPIRTLPFGGPLQPERAQTEKPDSHPSVRLFSLRPVFGRTARPIGPNA
jgi:small-conductance mechanosensitive channel